MPWFHCKKRMSTKFTRSQSIGLSCVGCDALNPLRNTCQNRPTLPHWKLPCCRFGMIFHRSSLIRQSCHFERDFDRVLLQLVDILNTALSLITERAADIAETFELLTKKLCKVWFVITWIFRMRLHVHLKKWTVKFKLVYLLNRIFYFNKIFKICGLNPRV